MPHFIPTRATDTAELSNDQFGYSVYSFVLVADPAQQRAVQEVRDAVRNQRSMLPAHVTAKGGVSEIPSLEAVQAVLDEIGSVTPKLWVGFAGGPHVRRSRDGTVISTLPIEVTPELSALHEALLRELDPISSTAYRLDMTGEYHPHLTIYHEPLPELESHGEELMETFDIGAGFEATELSFVGHVGTPYRGEWKLISTHKLSDPNSA